MRENLIFTNIEVKTKTTDGKTFKDTDTILWDFLQKELNITGVKFDRVHRIRSKSHNSFSMCQRLMFFRA